MNAWYLHCPSCGYAHAIDDPNKYFVRCACGQILHNWCGYCLKPVSTDLPESVFFRAIAVCPECIEKSPEAENHPCPAVPDPEPADDTQEHPVEFYIEFYRRSIAQKKPAPALREAVGKLLPFVHPNCQEMSDALQAVIAALPPAPEEDGK